VRPLIQKRSIVLNKKPLLKVEDLTVSFETEEGNIEITDKVSFEIYQGEIFGLAGESGCGKTVTALALLKLLPQPGGKLLSGQALLNGKDILSLSPSELRYVRGKDISMIFQEPAAALNPLLNVKRQLMECFEYHEFHGNREERVMDLLHRVGFPDPQRILSAFPHELSGGMLQRIMIAMALVMQPHLIIADEPTTALDVTIQAQIMELLTEMKSEMGTAILLITHNLSLIVQYANRLAVMYAGRIVEESGIEAFLKKPLHPYTQGLLEALPDLNAESPELKAIPGQVPQPKDYSMGCRFRDRCTYAFDPCVNKPDLLNHGERQRVACFLYDKGSQ
jgi:peptide/nickel transport system ATP-binding protein